MNEIRAFVGHSFTEDDAALVGKFRKYFDLISKLHPTFSWESAEAAEPKILAEKVMSIIANKNVFIGICTKKERAVDAGALSTILLQPEYRKAKNAELLWKTSDWIIQEIGLAKGRNLELILLVEEGLRKPGGLQGDVEYISFERDAPEKSFNKILEMLIALSPKASSASSTSQDVKSSVAKGQEQPTAPDDIDWKTPTEDWQRSEYERAMFHMILEEDIAGVVTINKAYLASPDAGQGDNSATWEARTEYLRLLFGKGGDLAKLKTLASKHPSNSKILGYLARGFAEYDDNAEAASKYEAASHVEPDAKEAKRLMGLAAIQFARAGAQERSTAIVDKLKISIGAGTTEELQLLKVLRNLAEIAKENDALLSIMERIVDITPEDFDTRFSLAYKHSESGNKDLALHHYLRIPHQERDKNTWNNLGVVFDEFALRGKSVQAYRKSEEKGETLAMSNLAYKLISAGFIPEAQELCDKALATKDYHKNVGQLLAQLKELPDEEDKKRDELLEKTKPKSEFYKGLGQAMSCIEPKTLAERWQGPDCNLDIKLSGNALCFSGTYERELGLLAYAMIGSSPASSKQVTRYRVEYSGTLRGRAIDGFVSRTREGDVSTASTILGASEDKTKVLMLLSDDGNEIKVMENPHGTNPTYYTFKRLITAAA